MNHDAELKLQAWLDGELSERDAAEVKEWVAQPDREAQLLLAELQNTAAALAGCEDGIKLPESRDFFWSKISRELERQERATAGPARTVTGPRWLLRLLVPVGAMAAVALLAVWLTAQSAIAEPTAPKMELASDDMGAYTYRDQAEGLTMIWFYDRNDDSQLTRDAAFASVNPR